MHVASRTPEGFPSHCPTCEAPIWVDPSASTGDVPCPNCGSLVWLGPTRAPPQDLIYRLAQLGAFVDADDTGEVRAIRFWGMAYNDSVIEQLGHLEDVPQIDLRDTAITAAGIRKLQVLLPHTTLVHNHVSREFD